ncbi:hypothetical protein MVEN_02289300 [Mycena venus]|uniref:F-box domain-containing protein n=1 Tax=Mycena venus TaxID=2733690 RepID=A0A8H6X5X1_9AGAR|nr:hypothetical protein MVEN_02289300 [Mycena venus]
MTPRFVRCAEVPTEVWARCWSHCSPQDLRCLVLVSPCFREVCQRLLFEHQHFSGPSAMMVDNSNWMEALRDIHRSILRLQKLAANKHLLSYVKSCEFEGSFDISSIAWSCPGVKKVHLLEEACDSFLKLFADTLGAFSNLRVLYLTSVKIDEGLRTVLLSLKLEELAFISCDVSCWTETILPLQKFTMKPMMPEGDVPKSDIQPLHIVSPDTLRMLTIGGHRNSTALFAGFAQESKVFPNLVSLSIELWDAALPRLITFLERCPQLEELEISKSELSRLPRAPLCASVIPLLHSFKGPRLLAAFFGRARPIEVIELSSGSGVKPTKKKPVQDDLLGDLAQIAQSCAGVRSFSLTVTFPNCPEVTSAIAAHWPELRELSLVLKRVSRQPTLDDIFGFSDSDDSDDDLESGSECDEEILKQAGIRMGGILPGNWEGEDLEETEMGSDYSGEPIEEDTRTFDLAELEAEFDAPVRDLSDDGEGPNPGRPCSKLPPADFEPIPSVLVPGHLYTASGHSSPPPEVTAPASDIVYAPITFPTLINYIAAGRLSLPPVLESVRLLRPSLLTLVSDRSAPTLADQHRAIIALERALPQSLREIEFESGLTEGEDRYFCQRIWRREGDVWKQSGGTAKIASLVDRRD